MEFTKSIIITDPCYISRDNDWGGIFDIDTNTIQDNSIFTNYIWETTGIGDGSWYIYKMNKPTCQLDLEEYAVNVENARSEYLDPEKSHLREPRLNYEKLSSKSECIGTFCVDSGTFGIFYLDEVLRYQPSFLSDYGSWCYTIVDNFIGNIDILKPDRNNFYIIGTGTISLFSNF